MYQWYALYVSLCPYHQTHLICSLNHHDNIQTIPDLDYSQLQIDRDKKKSTGPDIYT